MIRSGPVSDHLFDHVPLWALFALACLIVMFATVLVLIADLDRPLSGLLSVSQEPMIEFRRKLEVDARTAPPTTEH